MKLSIVVPALNEAGNIGTLIEGIDTALAGGVPFEIIIVNDGSTDGTQAEIEALMPRLAHLRLLNNLQNAGQSASVHNGVTHARGEIVATLDGDGQNPPSELPKLVAPLLDPNAHEKLALIAGQRVKRQDTWSKKAASKFANNIRQFILKDDTRDTGCGLKAFRRKAFLDLPFFNHMHRYLPALFKAAGWEVGHVDVAHAPRGAGTSNYTNWQRGLVGIVDLMGVSWLIRRKKRAKAVEHTDG